MWGPLAILAAVDVGDEGGAASEVGWAFVDDFGGRLEGVFADDDEGDVAAGGGEFGAGAGGEEGVGGIAETDGEGAVLCGKFLKTLGVGGDHGIEVGGDEGAAGELMTRVVEGGDLGPGVEHVFLFSLNWCGTGDEKGGAAGGIGNGVDGDQFLAGIDGEEREVGRAGDEEAVVGSGGGAEEEIVFALVEEVEGVEDAPFEDAVGTGIVFDVAGEGGGGVGPFDGDIVAAELGVDVVDLEEIGQEGGGQDVAGVGEEGDEDVG